MELCLRGRRGVRAAVLSAVVSALACATLAAGTVPVAAQDVPPDTVAVIKDDESPSNAEIAVRLSEATPLPDTSTVVIGRDDEFADSLASGVLQADAPLLLVPSQAPAMPDRVRAELQRLAPTRAIVLGGTSAIGTWVEDALADLGIAVERRAGDSRFETATAIAATDAPTADTAILARAFAAPGATDPTQGFADALAAGGLAAEEGWPVLLTQTEVLTRPTRDHLVAAGISSVKIMGGTAAISAGVEAELESMGITTQRIAGAGRAETAVEVAKVRGAESAADAAHVVLVQGQTADAWAGGFAAAARSALLDAPVVLAVETQLPPATTAWLAGGAEGGGGGAFAVDPSAGGPVLTCVTVPTLCEDARVALGLPPAGAITPQLASVGADGTAVGGRDAAVAADGAVVSFVSGGVVVAGVADGLDHVYVARLGPDGSTTTQLVDIRPDGTPAQRGVSFSVGATDLSPDGRFVAFTSDDGALASDGTTTRLRGAYVRDLQSGTTRLVSAGLQGEPVTSLGLVIDDDASTAVYRAQLPEGYGILVHDLTTGQVQPVRLPDGSPFVDNSGVGQPAVAGDGSAVAFYTDLPLLPADTNDGADVYVHDVASGELELVSVASDGSAAQTSDINDDGRLGISRDGRLVVFASDAGNLAPDDDPTGADRDVFLHDRTTGTTIRLSSRPDGTAAGSGSAPAISPDGRHAAFAASGDLTGSGTPGCGVYRADLASGELTRLDTAAPTSNCPGRIRVADGGAVVADLFGAFADADANGRPDVYRWPAPAA